MHKTGLKGSLQCCSLFRKKYKRSKFTVIDVIASYDEIWDGAVILLHLISTLITVSILHNRL